jgi:hypothetical protein
MSEHESFLQLLAGREIGGLDPDESARLDAHLKACPGCRREALSLAEATAELALAAPFRRPPPGMRSSILAAIHAEATAEAASAAVASDARDIEPSSARHATADPGPSDRAPGGWLAWLRGPRLGLAAVGLVGVLVVVSIGVGARALDLQSQLDTQNRAVSLAQQRLATQAAAMALVLDPLHVAASLQPEQLAPSAVAEVVYRPGSDQAYLIADHLPATPAGKVYQLWYADSAGAHPLGTFVFDGTGALVASFGVDLGGKAAAMVTLEPTGGSTGAPGPQVVFGSLPKH